MCATHSHPDLVVRANWNGEVALSTGQLLSEECEQTIVARNHQPQFRAHHPKASATLSFCPSTKLERLRPGFLLLRTPRTCARKTLESNTGPHVLSRHPWPPWSPLLLSALALLKFFNNLSFSRSTRLSPPTQEPEGPVAPRGSVQGRATIGDWHYFLVLEGNLRELVGLQKARPSESTCGPG